ncbi:Pls/PosA family non-ribosomal peptide synthetase [Lentzea sp. NPDC004789]
MLVNRGTLDDAGAPGIEQALTEILADVLRVEQVTADSHFFDDLGADSMVMAQFCARVRKRPNLPSISIKDTYQHPTITSLTGALAPRGRTCVDQVAAPVQTAPPVGTTQYVVCGILQVLILLGYASLAAFAVELGIEWVVAGATPLDVYLHTVLAGGAGLLGVFALPVLAKWLLIGRWRPQRIRIWSLSYVRFWMVKTLVTLSPLVLFAGSPLYVLYLRALGAKIGRGVVVFSRHAPVCTDLLTIGDGTVVRKDAFLTCYRARAGWIETGTVTLGRDAFVGEKSVLDIETSLGDGAQLGHTSSLHAGQAVPDHERWHGSPAQPGAADYLGIGPARCGTGRRAVYTVLHLASLLLVYIPLAYGGADVLLAELAPVTALAGPETAAFTSWSFYGTALVTSLGLFFGSALVGLIVVMTVPRVLSRLVEPDEVHPLYGIQYAAQRAITRLTNRTFFVGLLGDSSYVVGYLRGLGYRLAPVVQTGANFGKKVKHDTPYLVSVGSGTVIADGLSIANADFSSTSFRVTRTSIGPRNFLGNDIVYPSQGRTGDNCLLATKVLVPIDGKVRQGVGLLGSPSFEIPRTVERDSRFHHMATGDEHPARLAAKNKHNARTIGWFLLSRWCYAFGLTMLGFWATDLHASWGAMAIALFSVSSLLFGVVHFALVERAATAFRGTRPTSCSLYEPDCWRRERFLKLTGHMHNVLNGTPLKGVAWRLLGVRLGRRLFDDGCTLAEKDMVTIGDDCTLNAGSSIQCHSLEDFALKADRITIGSGCTVGVGALVHYGVTMGDGAVLAPDSFLMKGEEMPPRAQWGGNPAREMQDGGAGAVVVRSAAR